MLTIWQPQILSELTRMAFDWPAFVEDNQNNTSLLEERRVLMNKLMCRFEATMKKRYGARF